MQPLVTALFFAMVSVCCFQHDAYPADVSTGRINSNGKESLSSPSASGIRPFVAHGTKRANFAGEAAAHEVSQLADWIVDSRDNGGIPFMIVDKPNARAFVFNPDGLLLGTAPVLLGLAYGDESIPGIGEMKLSSIRPEDRTTPAGRFVAEPGRNIHGVEVLWVDYEGAVSVHPVITSNPKEQRLQRLATPTPLDNRITYGCINVAEDFFNKTVHSVFSGGGIVYVMPEVRQIREVFKPYDVWMNGQ